MLRSNVETNCPNAKAGLRTGPVPIYVLLCCLLPVTNYPPAMSLAETYEAEIMKQLMTLSYEN